MGDCFITRRGGVGKVTAIAVENAENLPSSKREGTIAVISSISVKSVYVQNTEPTAPVAGDVWVNTGVSSTAPVVVGNATIYPVGVKQYTTGVWKDVSAYVFLSGSWNMLEMYLFKDGDQCEDVTGGWIAATQMNGVAQMTDSALEAGSATAGQTYNRVAFRTADAVDISAYKTLRATFTPMTFVHSSNMVAVGVTGTAFAEGQLSGGSATTINTPAGCMTGYASTNNQKADYFTLEYDISTLSGSAYVVVYFSTVACGCTDVQLIP